eukprot:CAMPEP_0185026836 /NCGR_PEP_ID=MMETSP1103-20130426/11348_1 /TAXON_ID=36769 /ORGANISM="Paraphysomonas bandaiensis, Strain Caron Lab Isolate" /LENGTH=264 /DNA_ID=CAMNT_0027560555 /DNA_START=1 /DNA_END=795 /DNA_ORIENTATION=+
MSSFDLRPNAPYQFIQIPTKLNGVWQWDHLRVSESDELGKFIELLNPYKGLLIPMGGKQITDRQYRTMIPNPSRYNTDYLMKVKGVPMDGNPSHKPEEPNCWPASYFKEAARGTDALYNCQIVLLRTAQYPDMPAYPHIERTEFMAFAEWMVDSPRNMKDQWQTGWLVYSTTPRTRRTPLKNYVPKAFVPENFGPSWKTHWTANYISYETKELNERRLSLEQDSALSAPSRKRYRPPPPNHTGKRLRVRNRRPRIKLRSRAYEG